MVVKFCLYEPSRNPVFKKLNSARNVKVHDFNIIFIFTPKCSKCSVLSRISDYILVSLSGPSRTSYGACLSLCLMNRISSVTRPYSLQRLLVAYVVISTESVCSPLIYSAFPNYLRIINLTVNSLDSWDGW